MSQEDYASYYRNFFPIEKLNVLLNMNERTIAFFTAGKKVHRWDRHSTLENIRDKLVERGIARIDLGALLAVDSNQRYIPCENDLVFDLDLDDFKSSLPHTNMDERAWRHINLSTQILDAVVRKCYHETLKKEDTHGPYAYKSFCVASGRRGVHLWVTSMVRNGRSHLEIKELLNVIDDLKSPRTANALALEMDSQEELKGVADEILRYLDDHLDEATIQKLLNRDKKEHIDQIMKSLKERKIEQARRCALRCGIQMLRPIVDTQVTKSMVHLIKCPFSVHHETGVVSLAYPTHQPPTLDDVKKCKIDGIAEDETKRHFLKKHMMRFLEFIDRY